MDDLQVFLDGHTKKIKKTLNKVVDNFLYVGFLLWEVKELEYYKFSYDNFLDYVDVNFGFSKSSAYNFISLCERFSEKDSSGKPTFRICKNYKGYTMSQLIEMLSFSDNQIEGVSPSMSVRQIKDLKKDLKSGKKISEKFQTSGKSENILDDELINFDKGYYFDYVFNMLDVHLKIVKENGDNVFILNSIDLIKSSIRKKFNYEEGV